MTRLPDFTISTICICKFIINKQLLNEVVDDIENDQEWGLCYPLKPEAKVDITQAKAFIILDIMWKPNSIVVLSCIQSTTQNNEVVEHLMQNDKRHVSFIQHMFYLTFVQCNNIFLNKNNDYYLSLITLFTLEKYLVLARNQSL